MSADWQSEQGMGEGKFKIISEGNLKECSRGCCTVQFPASSEMGNKEESSFF